MAWRESMRDIGRSVKDGEGQRVFREPDHARRTDGVTVHINI
jgi:hypothetical protein